MLDALKTLFENNVISDDIRAQIQEAWDAKIRENRESVIVEMREEFAQKYEHDKQIMVEAIDQLLSENLKKEIAEFADDRKQLAEAKANFAIAQRETTKLMKSFVSEKLAEEIAELRKDKREQAEKIAQMEEFVVEALAKEIAEFHEDKRDVARTKVRLVREGREAIDEIKTKFIKQSAAAVSETVQRGLQKEIGQLKEDIESARRNDFGRRLFEAFSNEYMNSHLNERGETAKLLKVLKIKDRQIAEAKVLAKKATILAEDANAKNVKLTESMKREKIMNDLINPLNHEQKRIMKDLLETVQTDRLRTQFEKYLPTVIDGNGPTKVKAKLTEGKEVTGNRINNNSSSADDANVIELRRLAGLN